MDQNEDTMLTSRNFKPLCFKKAQPIKMLQGLPIRMLLFADLISIEIEQCSGVNG
jgi:hypothetical protein